MHILTNLRAHACKNGFDFFDKEAFIRVSEVNTDLISHIMVKHVFDQQNAEIAKTIFSKEVQNIMESNGDHKEANFVEFVVGSCCNSVSCLVVDNKKGCPSCSLSFIL